MSKISNEKAYPVKTNIALTDIVLGTDSLTSKKATKNFMVKDLVELTRYSLQDSLIEVGDITIENENELTIQPLVSWRINDVVWEEDSITIIRIPLAVSGFSRTDLIVGDSLGNIVYIKGAEGDIAVRPNKPLDTVLITELTTNDTAVGTIEPPFIGDDLVHKSGDETIRGRKSFRGDDSEAQTVLIDGSIEFLEQNYGKTRIGRFKDENDYDVKFQAKNGTVALLSDISEANGLQNTDLERLVAPQQNFSIPIGKTARWALVNGTFYVKEGVNNTDEFNTFTQSGTTVMFKEYLETGNYVIIFYQ